MNLRYRAACAGLALCACLLPGSGSASDDGGVEVAASVDFASQYVWRGLTVTNHPVMQPDLSLTLPLRFASLTLGTWSNVELGRYDGESSIRETAGRHGIALGEYDPYLELEIPLGERAVLSLGGEAYLYPKAGAATTVELHATLGFEGWLSPKIGLWYDVDAIQGAYFEAELSHRFGLGRNVGLDLRLAAGASLGQDTRYDEEGEIVRAGNFQDDGFTHAQLSATLPIQLGAFELAPSATVVYGYDALTRYASATRTQDVKGWLGVQLGFGRTLGGRAETSN